MKKTLGIHEVKQVIVYEDKVRMLHPFHEALTELHVAQPIMSLYPSPISMLHPGDINHNNTPILTFMSL